DRAREAHDARPLGEHLDDWEKAMTAAGASAKHARQTASCARRLFDACGFRHAPDIAGHPVGQQLARLREGDQPAALPPDQPWFVGAELAALLNASPRAVTQLVAQPTLAKEGNGPARVYPRSTAEALLAHSARGVSAKTCNLYLDAARSFCSWLVKERRLSA